MRSFVVRVLQIAVTTAALWHAAYDVRAESGPVERLVAGEISAFIAPRMVIYGNLIDGIVVRTELETFIDDGNCQRFFHGRSVQGTYHLEDDKLCTVIAPTSPRRIESCRAIYRSAETGLYSIEVEGRSVLQPIVLKTVDE